MSGRRKARELVLQACYALEMSGNPPEQVMESVILSDDSPKGIISFAGELFRCVVSGKEEYDELIKGRVANWEYDRIALIDKIIIRIAICEFIHFEDIPTKVSIDEAIELAKKFSTEQSGRFVNGIVDAVLIDLQKQGKVQKRGRGLDEGKKNT